MRFIDLFAGLGGFHQALSRLGHECVFACEKKEHLAKLYERNYDIKVNRNIRNVNPNDIPNHDILCAGFPCQPFSKAGNQLGLEDEANGSFFDIIVDILRVKTPTFFILENVRNLETHDDFKTWNYIQIRLEELGYALDKRILSPHNFNIPQHRERVFIVGSLIGLNHFYWPDKQVLTNDVRTFLDSTNAKIVEPEKQNVIKIWQEFILNFPADIKLPGFPIWSMEFGADYPIIPFNERNFELFRNSRGSFGKKLSNLSYEECKKYLPAYVLDQKEATFPSWKIRYIKNNRELYQKYHKDLKSTVNKIKKLPIQSWQKFEWNCGNLDRNIYEYIIQFRGSGVRIKKADFFPSLVTVSTQIPIIGWENRYLTPIEGAKIQSFEDIELPDNLGTSFGALGNAVNVTLVNLIAQNLLVEENPDNLIGANINRNIEV